MSNLIAEAENGVPNVQMAPDLPIPFTHMPLVAMIQAVDSGRRQLAL